MKHELPHIHGLAAAASLKLEQAEWCLLHATNAACDPRIAHENETRAAELKADAEKLSAHAQGNADLALNIETLIAYIRQSPHQSADRTLALRHLEDASMRLRREIGDTIIP